MVDKNEIMELLKKYFKTTGEITIDDKGLVSCTRNVELRKKCKRLLVSFDRVDGYFWCNNNQLATLKGAPQSVGGDFWCVNNQLTSLEHAPQSVGGWFRCSTNKLTTLAHAPTQVEGNFSCGGNQLNTLEHAPTSVGGSFDCCNNQLKTLEGAPTSVGDSFGCTGNQLTTLEGLPAIPGTLHLSYSPTLPLLRCLLAKQVQFWPKLEDKTVKTILNRYAGQGIRYLFDCQKELEDAGFEENARW